MKILYVASNPDDASELSLVSEITELQSRAVHVSGEPIEFIFLPALPFEKLPLELHNHRPDILHFSAHGKSGELMLANQSGKQVKLTGKMLCELLRYESPPKLVYFNACDSKQLAREITSVVSMAIGTTAPITNRAAWVSAVVFYERLLMGMPVENAFSAGQQMIHGIQSKAVSSVLTHVPGINPATLRLHSVPRIVAWPLHGKLQFDKRGIISLDVKLMGCPANTFQVIFFTDDKRFVLNEPTSEKSDAAFLAGELCQLVRDTPRRGIIETDDVWPTAEEFRIFACGTTSGGRTFTVASTICTALKDYAAHVLRWGANDRRNRELSNIVNQLESPDVSIKGSATSARAVASSSTRVKQTKPSGRSAAIVEKSKQQIAHKNVPPPRKRAAPVKRPAARLPKSARFRRMVAAKKAH